MGLFWKKKTQVSLPELPPPPSTPPGDIPPIRPPQGPDKEEVKLPEAPGPELPEMPEQAVVSEVPVESAQPPEAPAPQPEEQVAEMPKLPAEAQLPEAPALQPAEKASVFERRAVERIRKPVTAVFVSANDYRTIMKSAIGAKDKLIASAEVVRQLEELENAKENVFEKWRGYLEDVERRLERVDNIIAAAARGEGHG